MEADMVGALRELSGALGSAGAVGTWATVAAVVGVLVRLSKVPLVQKFLDVRPAWRPKLALALGAVLGVATHLSGAGDLFGSLAMGLAAALTAIGGHNLVTAAADAPRNAVGTAVSSLVLAGDAKALKATAAKLALIANNPDAAARRALLVELAKGNPPK